MRVVTTLAAVLLANSASAVDLDERGRDGEQGAGAVQLAQATAAPGAPGAAGPGAPTETTLSPVNVRAAPEQRLLLDEQTRTGSRLGLTSRETPAAVEVITDVRMQELGARTTQEALNRSAGVSFSLAPNGPVRLSLRGFSADAVSVLYDGTRATSSGSQSRNQDSWTFERIEVLHGPASVLYGEGALAGVINYVPKKAVIGQRFGEALASLGSFGTRRVAGDVNVPIGDNAAIRAVASYGQSNGYIDDTNSKFGSALVGFTIKPNSRLTIDLAADYSHDSLDTSYYGTPLVPRAVARNATDVVSTPNGLVLDKSLRRSNFNVENPVYDADTYQLRSRVGYKINDVVSFTNEFSVYDSRHRFINNAINFAYVPASGLVTRARSIVINDFESWTERAMLSFDAPIFGGRRNRFAIGAEVSKLDFTSFRRLGATFASINPYAPVRGFSTSMDDPVATFPTATTESTTVRTTALFIEDAFNITPEWLLVGGLRSEKSDVDRKTFDAKTNITTGFAKNFSPVSSRLGTVYSFTPNTQVFAQYSTAIVPLSALTLLSFANSRFDLTTGKSAEAGAKSTIFKDTDLTFSVYRIKQDNIITRDPNNPAVDVQGGRRSSRGAELMLSSKVTGQFRIDASYTKLRANLDQLIEAGNLNRAGNRPASTPESIANLFAIYSFREVPVFVSAGLRYEGPVFLDNANTVRVNSHTTLDAAVGYRSPSFGELTLRARNLTDKVYADASSPATTQVVLAPGRTIDLTLRMPF